MSLQKHFPILHSEKKLFVMKYKRDSVIALYLAGKPHVAFVRVLQHLNVNKSFVSLLLVTMILTMLHCVQKGKEKNRQQHQKLCEK